MAVDPDVATLLEVVAATGTTWDADTDLEAARAGWQLLLRTGTGCPEVASVEERRIDGPAGGIDVRIYRPEAPVGALVWFHGGGFVLGGLDSHDGLARLLAARAGCAVIAVDYRLAPEHVFPAAQEDALAAYRWAAEEVAGGPGGRVAVGGDSAGGSLAAHVALVERAGDPSPAAMLLACPVTDLTDRADRGGGTASMREKADGFLLTAQAMAWFSDRCVPDETRRADPRVSVLHEPDLAGVCPTLVITAEHDPLRDQGEAFAERLAAAGVAVTPSRYHGTVHAFFGLVELLESGRRSLDEAAAFLRAHLGETDGEQGR